MNSRTGNNSSVSSQRITLGATLGNSDGRTVGGEKSGPVAKVKLDSARILGDCVEGRTVGGKKSGLIGKVHLDPAKVMGTSAAGKTVGSAKSGEVGK